VRLSRDQRAALDAIRVDIDGTHTIDDAKCRDLLRSADILYAAEMIAMNNWVRPYFGKYPIITRRPSDSSPSDDKGA
jgi:hypothetical protein